MSSVPVLDVSMPSALRLGHNEIRAGLVRASMEEGPLGEAAKRVARLCLAHFEQEEKTVLPVFALLQEIAESEVKPEMASILPTIAEFSARHDTLDGQHHAIRTALDDMLKAAYQGNRPEFAELAYSLRLHEKMEEEVIYPAVVLVGKYIEGKLQ